MSDRDEPLDELREALRGSAEELCLELLGKPDTRSGSEWRWGKRGSLSIVVRGAKRGLWKDHEADEGGDLLALIRRERGGAFPDVVRWARGFVGLEESEGWAPHERKARPGDEEPADTAENAAKAERPRRLWREAVPVAAGSAADLYLTGRGIPRPTSGWPAALRFHPGRRALVVAATTAGGDVQAVQLVHLTPEGKKREPEEGRLVKQSFGPQEGAVVRLPGDGGVLILAEGPETGLTAWAATGRETWVALGSIAKIAPPPLRRLLVVADDDPRDAPVAKVLRKAVVRWRGEAREVAVVMPWPHRRFDKSDLNDLIQREGVEAVRATIAAALASQEREAAPIAPTYPDRGEPLPVAKVQADEALGRFAKRIRAGETPQLLLREDVGAGKTFAAIEALPAFLGAGRAIGRGPALFLHPRHALGDQIAADIRHRHPRLKVAVYRGMEADDPANPGRKMCGDPELPRAARAAGQSATAGCAACPLAPGCAYLRQARDGRDADVWVAPHQTLFTRPFAGWPKVALDDGRKVPAPPSVVIVDEDITGAALMGLNPLDPKQLALSALASDEAANLTDKQRVKLLDYRLRALDALHGQPAGGVSRKAVEWAKAGVVDVPDAGVFSMSDLPKPTGTIAREWARLEWETKPKVRIAKGTSRDAALAAFAAAAEGGFNRRRARLAEEIGAFLDGGDARSVNLTLVPDAELGRGQGTGPAVRFAWREDIHDAWAGPLLFLDATGRPEVLRHWAPELKVADIEVSAPYQYVVQVSDQEFGRRWLLQPGRVRALVDLLLVEIARADGPVLGIAQKAVERLIRPELVERGAERDPLPEGADEDAPSTWRFPSGAVLHLAHHGDVTGSNAWAEVAGVVVIGRPATNRLAGERRAEVLAGKAVDTVHDAPDSWWPMTTAALRMKDGAGRAIARQPRHPDPLVEAMRWSVTEGAVLQAIGRARGVRRTRANPVRVVVLAALALPLTVAENPTWDEYRPGRLVTAAAEAALFGRALPLGAADQVEVGLSPSLRTAERDLADFEAAILLISTSYKGNGGFKTLARARYRKGLRGRWSAALVPLVAGRAALEALVGPLAAFTLDEPAPPTEDAQPTAPPPAVPEPPMPSPSPPFPWLHCWQSTRPPRRGELRRPLVCESVAGPPFDLRRRPSKRAPEAASPPRENLSGLEPRTVYGGHPLQRHGSDDEVKPWSIDAFPPPKHGPLARP